MRVGTASIIMMCIAMAAGIVIPVTLFIVIRKKSGGTVKAFFVGCITIFLSAMVLESIVHNLVFMSPVGQTIFNNIWLYGIYGGFMAGLFEETGRFLAFKTALKKQLGNDGNALMYGAGHGGFEAFYILVFNMLNQIIYACLINSGAYQNTLSALPEDQAAAVMQSFTTLAETPAPMFLLSIVERGGAIILHMGLTIFVWYAVKRGGRKLWYYPLAILLHMLTDTSMVIFNSYVGNVYLTEAFIWVTAILVAALALYVWKKERAQEPSMEQKADAGV